MNYLVIPVKYKNTYDIVLRLCKNVVVLFFGDTVYVALCDLVTTAL